MSYSERVAFATPEVINICSVKSMVIVLSELITQSLKTGFLSGFNHLILALTELPEILYSSPLYVKDTVI